MDVIKSMQPDPSFNCCNSTNDGTCCSNEPLPGARECSSPKTGPFGKNGLTLKEKLRKEKTISCGDFELEDIEDLKLLHESTEINQENWRRSYQASEIKLHNGYKNGNDSSGDATEEESTVVSDSYEPLSVSNDLNPKNYQIYVKTWGCSHNSSDSEYMAGLLKQYGFSVTTTDSSTSDLWLLNSCTVKGPSEQHFKNEIDKAITSNKRVVLAGCVPQADKKNNIYKQYSTIGVQQIDQVVHVVEETLRGNCVHLMGPKKGKRAEDNFEGKAKKLGGAVLSLPKMRKNQLIEIIPVSTGCLNSCTYCKTKLARGDLASYSKDEILSRAKHVIENEGVKEVWLTSEDLGAWGIDLGLTIVDLLDALIDVFPPGTRLRLGMTNPPYILNHLQAIAEILNHPQVYRFLHIPVQSGSDNVLADMKREYCVADFERIVDYLTKKVPNLTIATDIICGYPTETEADFQETVNLIEKYKFRVLFINQFYPRPGTRAAKLPRLPTQVAKDRTRKLTDLFYSYLNSEMDKVTESGEKVGSVVEDVLITDISHDKMYLVGHDICYNQILVKPKIDTGKELSLESIVNEPLYGQMVDVRITQVISKFSMLGDPVNIGSVVGSKSSNKKLVYVFSLLILIVATLYALFYKS